VRVVVAIEPVSSVVVHPERHRPTAKPVGPPALIVGLEHLDERDVTLGVELPRTDRPLAHG
jgi:hypothetical protein